MLLIGLIASINIVTGVNVKLIPDERNTEVSNLAMCVHNICQLHKDFYKLTIVIYTKNPSNHSFDYIFTDTVTRILGKNRSSFIKTDNLYEINKINDIREGTVLVVIYAKYCKDLTDQKNIIFDKKFRYIIIFDSYLSEKCHEVVKTKLFEVNHYDVTFVTADIIRGKYNFITAIPEIDAVTCVFAKVVIIKTINVCQHGLLHKMKITNVFPDKEPTNLKMCSLNVGMATLYPYSMISNSDTLNDLDTVENIYGADLEVMKIMAYKYKSTLKLFYIYRDEQNPYIHQEFVQYLLNGTLDACAGGLYRVYGDIVSYSGVYTKQAVFWVYTVERNKKSWQSLVVKMTGLYMFLMTYACYAVLWKVFNRFDHRTVSIFNSFVYGWGALVGASSLQDARTLKQKILNIMYLIMCLHLSAYVSTQIYYYLTIVGPPKLFKTTDDLRSSNRMPFLIPKAKYFVSDKKHVAYANKSYECDDFIQCEEIMLKNKATTIILEGLLPELQSSTSIDDEARVMRVAEDIIVTYHEIIIRKNSPIVKSFQKSIQSLFETGICQKEYYKAIGITLVEKSKIVNKNILSNSYSCTLGCKINFSQVAIVFYIWIAGCLLSFCIFVFEILAKAPSLKNPSPNF